MADTVLLSFGSFLCACHKGSVARNWVTDEGGRGRGRAPDCNVRRHTTYGTSIVLPREVVIPWSRSFVLQLSIKLR